VPAAPARERLLRSGWGQHLLCRNNRQGTLLTSICWVARTSMATLLFGREFRGELLGGTTCFSGVITDDGHYLLS